MNTRSDSSRQLLIASALTLGLGSLACERDLPREPGVATPSSVAKSTSPDPKIRETAQAHDRKAHASFVAAAGVNLTGEVDLEEVDGGLVLEVDVEKAPEGFKGIHVHERGDCSDIRGKSMGAHFAPEPHEHGLPDAAEKHLGDLGNISIDHEGEGELKLVVKGANLIPGDPRSFLGKAVVIHTAHDQGGGDPSGKSGDPIACAVIVEGDHS